jgi:hypothetical protein
MSAGVFRTSEDGQVFESYASLHTDHTSVAAQHNQVCSSYFQSLKPAPGGSLSSGFPRSSLAGW